MTDTFAEMMSQKIEDIEPPKPLPAGLYRATYIGWNGPREVQTQDGTVHVLDLKFQVNEPLEDIDLEGASLPASREMSIWAEYDDNGNFKSWGFKLRRALEAMDEGLLKLPVNEALEEAIGSEVVVEVTQSVSRKDPEQVFWNIKSVRPAE